MQTYKITPLITMYMDCNEHSMFTYMQHYGDKVTAPVVIWLVQGNGHNVLVDSGSSKADIASRYHHPSRQTPEMLPAEILRAAGVECKDIDTIILTHLHWDHCYNLELFPNAEIYIQKKELEYAVDPLPCHRFSYELGNYELTPPWLPFLRRMCVKDGDYELFDGIRVYHLPGHTPGMQCPVIHTTEGDYLVASDNIPLYENWEGNEKAKHIPGTIMCNMFDYYKSLERIETICDAVLPGHDIKVAYIGSIG